MRFVNVPITFDGSPAGCSNFDSTTGDTGSMAAVQFAVRDLVDHTWIGTPFSPSATVFGPVWYEYRRRTILARPPRGPPTHPTSAGVSGDSTPQPSPGVTAAE